MSTTVIGRADGSLMLFSLYCEQRQNRCKLKNRKKIFKTIE